jgi:hypothetical protein
MKLSIRKEQIVLVSETRRIPTGDEVKAATIDIKIKQKATNTRIRLA